MHFNKARITVSVIKKLPSHASGPQIKVQHMQRIVTSYCGKQGTIQLFINCRGYVQKFEMVYRFLPL